MNHNLPVLVLAFPLLAAFAVNLLGKISKKHVAPWTLASLILSAGTSLWVLKDVLQNGKFSYTVGGWMAPYGIELVLDPLSALMLVMVSWVALIATFSALPSIKKEMPGREHLFFSLYLILICGMMGLVITGDAFNLYVLLEITSITTYGLIAMGKGRAPLSSFNYIIMGTIGACFYLLGVGYLYLLTGTLNMADIASRLPALYESPTVATAFCFLIVGVWIKMAFFPLHGWLPNAYTYAPKGASVLVAPLMTKVSVFLMIRIMFSIYSPEYDFLMHLGIKNLVVWAATIAIVGASLIALTQKDFLKMLSYIVVAEVGYMVGGVWLANQEGLTGAIFHILNDSLMTLCFFLVASAIAYRTGSSRIADFRGLFQKMPLTMLALSVGALSVVGVPPTCGFFSKWYLLLGGVEAGQWEFVAALIFSSIVNAVLFYRVFEVAFSHSEEEPSLKFENSRILETSPMMIPPLVVIPVVLLVIGLSAGPLVREVIRLAVPAL
ncbi:MAG: monovalent cation/H+ antiporter subunit D family protein [Deltaproteobacteria bacterium]|nr:monovalent cation/H+ antiporter subunit D family protein [Deltaproteobacteria bacterium]